MKRPRLKSRGKKKRPVTEKVVKLTARERVALHIALKRQERAERRLEALMTRMLHERGVEAPNRAAVLFPDDKSLAGLRAAPTAIAYRTEVGP